jgi:uncharacterized protein (TIGR02001 family)
MLGAAASTFAHRAAATLAAMLLAGPALAQWSGSVGADSDYRFRGESLGGGRPTLRLGANYDAAGGWYAGASATQTQLTPGERYAQVLAYVGHVHRLGPAASVEVGLTRSVFVKERGYDFAEAYAGLLLSSVSVRLALSPDYFGQHMRTAYLDGNASLPLAGRARVLAHAGVLVPLSNAPSPAAPDAHRARADLRTGVAWDIGSVGLELTWSAVTPGGPPPVSPARRHGWGLGATCFF